MRRRRGLGASFFGAFMSLPRSFTLCTGAARESIACRSSRGEPYDPTTLPPPANVALARDDMSDLELVLKQYGIRGLGVLNVSYADGVALHGAATRVDNSVDTYLGTQPDIQWDCGGCSSMVLMIDADCGGRRRTAPERVGWCGPVLHGMWHGCTKGSLNSCTPRLSYAPPGVSRGTNRYSFVLLKQKVPLDARSLPAISKKGNAIGSYDLARLLASNQLEPLAWNFMHVTGRGMPAWKKRDRGRRGKHGAKQRVQL